MNNRSALIVGIVSGIFVAEFIIYVLGFPVNNFGFWALYIQLEGCVIIAINGLKSPAAKKTLPKPD